MSGRLLFLDLDGVVNHTGWLAEGDDGVPFDPACVARVRRICLTAGASVVVSSTWRLMYPTEGHQMSWLRGLLRGAGLGSVEIVGATPEFVRKRGDLFLATERHEEIRAYLAKVPAPFFCILDDDADAAIEGHFVKTDFRFGIQEHHVEQAIEILKKPAPSFAEARGR